MKMSEQEESEDCSPDFLTDMFEILDINKKHVSSDKSKQIQSWREKYKEVSDEYNRREIMIAEQIEEFNQYSEECSEELLELSRRYINIVGQSPGETNKFRELLKSAKLLRRAIRSDPDSDRSSYQAVKKLCTVMTNFEKSGKPIDLETVNNFADELENIL
jgi:hypothetical protein